MSGAFADVFGNVAGEAAAHAGPSGIGTLADIGTDIAARETGGEGQQQQTPAATPHMPRRRRGSIIGKQEIPVSDTETMTAEQLENQLAALLDAQKTPEDKATLLVKLNFYRQDLQKYADSLRDLPDEMAEEVVEEWFASGDRMIKTMVWNATAGAYEIPLQKAAPIEDSEALLSAMMDDCANDDARRHLLSKIGTHAADLSNLRKMIIEAAPDQQEELLKAWLQSEPGEYLLRKAVLHWQASRSANQIYGSGEYPDNAVRTIIGNAPAYAGEEVGSGCDDDNTGRTTPKVSKAPGGGGRSGFLAQRPEQDDGESPDVGSGPNDDPPGGGAINPKKIRRKGSTGNLGSVAGADGDVAMDVINDTDPGAADMHNDNGANLGVRRRKDGRRPTEKSEPLEDLAVELVKLAPDDMVEAVLELPTQEEQDAVMLLAAQHAADLMAWSDQSDPDNLAKRDLDASVEQWLCENPDELPLKLWVAEALVTSEEIPLELGKAILEYEMPRAALGKRGKHPGFEGAARSVAGRSGMSMERARAVIGAASHGASKAAVRANPRLKRVPGVSVARAHKQEEYEDDDLNKVGIRTALLAGLASRRGKELAGAARAAGGRAWGATRGAGERAAGAYRGAQERMGAKGSSFGARMAASTGPKGRMAGSGEGAARGFSGLEARTQRIQRGGRIGGRVGRAAIPAAGAIGAGALGAAALHHRGEREERE